MTPERYQQIKSVYLGAEELPAEDRDAYIRKACNGDTALMEEVNQLFANTATADPLLSLGAQKFAPELIKPSILGQTIGHYKIVRELGAGGMGRVYLATRTDDFRKMAAIKLLRAGVDSDALIARFRIERQILAAFDHPNIARLVDGGTNHDGLPYLVMEYIEGQPIDAYCDERRLSIDERLRLFLLVCAAVQYAHRNLVVHRDLKPSNIMVMYDGTPKLLDFGIAKLLRPDFSPVTQAFTAADVRPMTPEYASPEQVLGAPITTAADVYSLGVILYELLTGHKPHRFKTHTPLEMYQIARQAEPTRPSTAIRITEDTLSDDGMEMLKITPESVSSARKTQPEKLRRVLAGDLDNILLRALQKEPQERYSSVEQFAEDIRRYLEGLPVTACKETLFYRTSKYVRRHKGPVAASALVLLTLIGGIVTTTWQARASRAQHARAERRFQDVRHLANSVLYELHDAIEKLPGSTHARELLVKRGLEYLDSLAGEASGDKGLQLELADAYERVGAIQWNKFGGHLGNRDGAEASQRKAFAIRQAVLAADPRNRQARSDLGDSYLSIGDIETDKQNLQAALRSYQESLSIRQEAVAAKPKDTYARRNLSEIYQRIGDLLGDPFSVNMGDTSGALENFLKMLEIDQQIVAEQPEDGISHQNMAAAYQKLGHIRLAQNDLAGALEMYRKELAEGEESFHRQPGNVMASRDLAVAYDNIGTTLVAQGNLPPALDNFARMLAIREPLAAEDPQNREAHDDVVDSLQEASLAAVRAGRSSDAERYTQRAIAVEKTWAERPNATARDWNDYAVILLNCKPPQLRQPPLALTVARKAAEMSGGRDADILETLAKAFWETGEREQAARVERDAIAVHKAKAEQPGATAIDWNDYAWLLLTCDPPELRRPALALPAAKRAVEMDGRRDGTILDTLARAWFDTGDRAQAIQTEREALARVWNQLEQRKEYEGNLRRFEGAGH